jgi:endonuclease YncB( thermonuclease family)
MLRSIFCCCREKIPDNLNPKDLPLFIPPLKGGKVIKVYDGDTITIASLNGIDTPEMKGKNEEEKEIAVKARDALSERIMGKEIRLENVQTEKYGRLLCEVYLGNDHLNKWMIDERYALKYDGGTKVIPKSWKNYHEKGEL